MGRYRIDDYLPPYYYALEVALIAYLGLWVFDLARWIVVSRLRSQESPVRGGGDSVVSRLRRLGGTP